MKHITYPLKWPPQSCVPSCGIRRPSIDYKQWKHHHVRLALKMARKNNITPKYGTIRIHTPSLVGRVELSASSPPFVTLRFFTKGGGYPANLPCPISGIVAAAAFERGNKLQYVLSADAVEELALNATTHTPNWRELELYLNLSWLTYQIYHTMLPSILSFDLAFLPSVYACYPST